jgi:hypothetical protein
MQMADNKLPVRISADLNTKYGIIETLKRKHLNAMPGGREKPIPVRMYRYGQCARGAVF